MFGRPTGWPDPGPDQAKTSRDTSGAFPDVNALFAPGNRTRNQLIPFGSWGNQPALLKDFALLLDDPDAPPGDVATTTDGDHGRIETRRAQIVTLDMLGHPPDICRADPETSGGGMVAEAVIPELDDKELMRAVARDRDRSAFGRLFDLYAPKVKAFLLRGGLESSVSEELVQDVMLTLWRRADTYDPAQAGVATWIYAIARNRRIDHFRRAREVGVESTESVEEGDPEAATDRIIEQRQQHARLRAAVAALPEEQADVLRRAFFEHKSHSEIASECALPLGTIKSRIRLAMSHLRRVLEEKEQ